MDHKTMFHKMMLSKRLTLAQKNNCFFQEASSVDKITFRDNDSSFQNHENKENLADLINKTIKLKEKTISNTSNLFSSNSACDKLEKSTPGFNKHQKKFDVQESFVTKEKPPSPSKKCALPEKSKNNSNENVNSTSTRLKRNKKTASCLWESTNLSFDQAQNMSIDSNKDYGRKMDLKHSTNLNLSTNMNVNIARKLKLPTNHFWKKFIGKSNNINSSTNQKNQEEKEDTNKDEEMCWMKKELRNLKQKVEKLEKNEKNMEEKTDKLEKKYKKLKKEKEMMKKVNSYLIDQNKGILSDLKEISSKSSNKSFETVLKSLNEFEVKLKNSIVCSNKLIIS